MTEKVKALSAEPEHKHFDEWKTVDDICGFGNPATGIHLSFAEWQKIGAMMTARDERLAELKGKEQALRELCAEPVVYYFQQGRTECARKYVARSKILAILDRTDTTPAPTEARPNA